MSARSQSASQRRFPEGITTSIVPLSRASILICHGPPTLAVSTSRTVPATVTSVPLLEDLPTV
jgi:hypothetical protein